MNIYPSTPTAITAPSTIQLICFIDTYLFNYFPEAVRTDYPEAIASHPLRKEITATVITSQVVDNAGSTFFQELWEDTSEAGLITFSGSQQELDRELS